MARAQPRVPSLTLALAALLSPALLADEGEVAARDPTGRWTLEKGGTVDISPAPSGGERRYEARWETPAGKYPGIGLVRDGRLTMAWGEGVRGVMVLRRDGGGWSGDWTTRSRTDGRLGLEAWAGEALEGERELTGTRPDGAAYRGKVNVIKRGELYALSWSVGSEQTTGVGLPLDADHVAIAFGPGDANYGAISFDLAGGDAIEGRGCAGTDYESAVARLRRASKDPAGVWSLEGGGTVTVASASRGDRFTAAWDTPGGKYDGIGLVRRGHLLVGFSAAGIMHLRREGDGWGADWTTRQQEPVDRLGTETWAGSTLAGAHAFEGVNPDGTPYRGEVVVTIKGPVYEVRWTVGEQQTIGIGLLLHADHVAVAFGVNETPGVAVYDLTGQDVVTGRWGQLPVEKIGVEDLKR